MSAVSYSMIPSPIGRLLLVARGEALVELRFPNEPRDIDESWARGSAFLTDVSKQIQSYFANRLTVFDVELVPEGTTFQRAVWNALLTLPYGQTCSYGAIAKQIGKPAAVRAVGAANGRNPIPILIPCHRVIGSNGKLTGFGGGLPTKRLLLDLESGRLADWENSPG